jgi:hypothetical protein
MISALPLTNESVAGADGIGEPGTVGNLPVRSDDDTFDAVGEAGVFAT